ncbi:MAG: tRNA-dihydrouridine synthase family protein [Armatimonadetes bacterium]|nr:tRNA-dihydrouridine synthase family protein [Armatimonadota bacterium]
MDGITDAAMRAFQGAQGAFTGAVSEFVRVSNQPLPRKVFARDVPELATGCRTETGLHVQVQILGGDPDCMAASALNAVSAGADSLDINFGCPAPTVNRNDGGASILRCPNRVFEITRAVRQAVPPEIPVSVKVRLGWDTIDAIHANAEMAERAGAAWITIHARTKTQGYSPPVYWEPVAQVRRSASIPIVANGDIWTLDDLERCESMTGCRHFMIGRPALADPRFPHLAAQHLGLAKRSPIPSTDWVALFEGLLAFSDRFYGPGNPHSLNRLKQWLALASRFGRFEGFDNLKRIPDRRGFLDALKASQAPSDFISDPSAASRRPVASVG